MRLLTLMAMLGLIAAAPAQTSTPREGYWLDKDTGLMWAAGDNAFGVSWTQASNYCRALTLSGYKDWALPGIDDLQRLFGGPSDQNRHHVEDRFRSHDGRGVRRRVESPVSNGLSTLATAGRHRW